MWVERTPSNFTFNVKAFRLFTNHQTPLLVLPKDIRYALGDVGKANVYYGELPAEITTEMWRRFREAIQPLKHAGKLGAILFQFPPWFTYRADRLDHILACQAQLSGWITAVEFRHVSWFAGKHRDATLNFERHQGLVHVCVDEPQGFDNTVPWVGEVTNHALAVVRLHGRNRATWDIRSDVSANRFDHEYGRKELSELSTLIADLARQANKVQVLFNVNKADQATRGARELLTILRDTAVG